jgi:uncharacterized repeat protein (TIGR01451 family)
VSYRSLARWARLPQRAPIFTHFARRSWLIWALVFVGPLLLVLALFFPAARAADIPVQVSNDYQLETFGPSYPISQAGWYTNPANGVGAGYHYAEIDIPCGWPANKSIGVDLFSPSMDQNGASDEPRANGTADTTFELYAPGTAVGSGLASPGPGAPGSLVSRTYAPSATARWQRLTTLAAPVPCGAYILRSEAQDDDGNVWRLHVGYDNDADPANRVPRDADNPDGVLGTGDEIALAVVQTAFKHPQRTIQCLDLYEYVSPGQGSAAFHNYDMEATGSVTYYSPSGASFAGTPSGARVWNKGTATSRGPGDVIANPEAGWWRISTCAGNDAHFIQEGQTGVPAYFRPRPTPRMAITKDDGRATANPGDVLNYTIGLTNTANMAPAPLAFPGAAQKLVLSDPLPAHTSFQSCAIEAPLAGSCGLNAGVVMFSLNGPLVAGAHGRVHLALAVDANAPTGALKNEVGLGYQDDFGHAFAATASDVDALQLPPADLSLTKTVDNPRPNVGERVRFEIVVANGGPADATNLVVGDPLPAGLAFVSAAPNAGTYDAASGAWRVGGLPVGRSARLVLIAAVTHPNPVTNIAQVTSVDQPDPDSTPNNGAPGEDDQASALVRPQVADLSLSKNVSKTAPQAGETFFYTVVVANHGPDAATNVAVSDPLPAGVVHVSSLASQGSYDNTSGAWQVGTLAPGASANLSIVVTATTNGKITNYALVSAAALFDPDSTPGNSNPAEDDQASVTTPIAPTAVTLVSFGAIKQAGGVVVTWDTSAEINTWGFVVYRSGDGLREHAVRVTPQPLPARGRGQGASYSFVDQDGLAGATYWLAEVETGGAIAEYGPARVAVEVAGTPSQVFLPLLAR